MDANITLQDAMYLSDLIAGVTSGLQLEYYHAGTETNTPATYSMRAFTREFGGFISNGDNLLEAYVWLSGMTERWLKVSDLIKALRNFQNGDSGLDKPMAIIRK